MENSKNIEQKTNKLIYLVSNIILGFVVVFVCTAVASTKLPETVAAIAEYNGTIYAGDQNSNKVTLMINVYWGNEFLEEMLSIFEKYNAKTTFFVGGSWVNENRTLALKIKSNGHEIGNHGMTHASLGSLGYQANHKEIQTCHDVVREILGVEMNLLAPPSGSYSQNTVKAASSLGYKTIIWTRDTIDWRDRDENVIFSRAVKDMKGGDLVLMHPTKETAKALPRILEYIKNNNLVLTTVSDNIG